MRGLPLGGTEDVILANPPYVPDSSERRRGYREDLGQSTSEQLGYTSAWKLYAFSFKVCPCLLILP